MSLSPDRGNSPSGQATYCHGIAACSSPAFGARGNSIWPPSAVVSILPTLCPSPAGNVSPWPEILSEPILHSAGFGPAGSSWLRCFRSASAGCVQRRMMIRSNPPGALVYVDDYEIGTTPVSHNFTYYGTRKIRLVKDGYETLTLMQPIPTPWYEIPPLDFCLENLVPGELRDHRTLDYQLRPQMVVPPDELLGRAEALRGHAPGVRRAGDSRRGRPFRLPLSCRRRRPLPARSRRRRRRPPAPAACRSIRCRTGPAGGHLPAPIRRQSFRAGAGLDGVAEDGTGVSGEIVGDDPHVVDDRPQLGN